MDCGGRNSGMAHSNGDLMQIADYISSSIEASNGGLLVTVYFPVAIIAFDLVGKLLDVTLRRSRSRAESGRGSLAPDTEHRDQSRPPSCQLPLLHLRCSQPEQASRLA